jgi:hypothetical protein
VSLCKKFESSRRHRQTNKILLLWAQPGVGDDDAVAGDGIVKKATAVLHASWPRGILAMPKWKAADSIAFVRALNNELNSSASMQRKP